MEKTRFLTNPADRSRAKETPVGPYRLAVEHREVSGDGGLTIHVFGPKDGAEEEILRFDCFRAAPHYHLGLSYRDEPHIPIEDPKPFDWSLRLLSSSFAKLVKDAGADSIEPDAWERELPAALEALRHQGETLIPAP
jgi:hypothetical protein